MYKLLCLILLLLTGNVFSQPATIIGTAVGEAGQTVSISIDYLGTGSEVVGYQVDINFDNTNLTVGINCNSTLGSAGIGCVDNGSYVRIIVFGLSNDALPNGQVGLLNFTISPGVIPPSIFPISVSNEVYSQVGGIGVSANGSIDGSIMVDQLFAIGGDVSGLNSSSVTLQNNLVDTITINANGPFVFPVKLENLSNYNVLVSDQPLLPDQTCSVSGGSNNNGTGVISAADVDNILISCNDSPVLTSDSYTIFEDTSLLADDVNGVVNDSNDDSVLVNDFDLDSLMIVDPGVYDPIAGIGGQLTINSNGTFEYIPDENTFGTANFAYEVTDGLSVVPSLLSIDVQAVNDAPTFDTLGNIDAVPLLLPPDTFLQIPDFLNNINFGEFESGQLIEQINLDVISDSNNILEVGSVSINAMGGIEMNLTFNEGIALLQLSLQDNGGVNNGGIDTSDTVEFSVSYIESIYDDGFEDTVLLDVINSTNGLTLENEVLIFKGHDIELYDFNRHLISIKKLNYWMKEIEIYLDNLH
jgi:hypothetical protein